jgi:CRISPR-associated endoribonuclease Cas6
MTGQLHMKDSDTIEISFSSTTPAKLYALQLKLRPLQRGTLMPFSGKLVHGAFLNWLRTAAPDVVTWLHDGNKRRLFTCSSLQFPLPVQRMQEAERENTHLPLDPEKTYLIRLTFLLGELFPLFYEALMRFNESGSGKSRPPFMQIGKQLFLLEEVIIHNTDPTGWTGFTSLTELVENVKASRLNHTETLKLEFASLTTFNRSSLKNRGYGTHYACLPLPHYLFPGLVRRWQDIAPAEMAGLVQLDRIERYIQEDGIIIINYDLKPHHVRFTTHQQPGFVGACEYHLRGPDEEMTPDAPLTVRQQLLLLANLSFYCGIGYKTSMGMGQTRLREKG